MQSPIISQGQQSFVHQLTIGLPETRLADGPPSQETMAVVSHYTLFSVMAVLHCPKSTSGDPYGLTSTNHILPCARHMHLDDTLSRTISSRAFPWVPWHPCPGIFTRIPATSHNGRQAVYLAALVLILQFVASFGRVILHAANLLAEL